MNEHQAPPGGPGRDKWDTLRVWFIWFFYIFIVGGGLVYHFLISRK